MIRQKILQQLLEWIECNLEHPISIEDIAQKSGYSRRNIQLLFRNFMHVGFAPIFPDTCYHLTHYWPAAADIPV
ncbi:hypothetical protein ACK6WQ_23160, partial [Escherichia coli]